jgi:hypothetical protein
LMKLKLPEAARSALRKPLEFHWSRFRGLTGSRWSWPHWIKRETWGWWQEFCNSQEKQKTCMDRYDMYIYNIIYIYINRFTYESIIIIVCLNIIEHIINIY